MKQTLAGPVILIILGGTLLLSNFGFLPIELWTEVWKFWPILLILFGIEILLGRTLSLRTLLILALLVFLAPILLILNPLSGNPLGTKTVDFAKPLGSATKARLSFDLPTGNLEVKPLERNSSSLFKGKITYSKLNSEPLLNEEGSFGVPRFVFSQNKKPPLPLLGNISNNATFALTSLIPIEVQFKSVTGSAKLDLKGLRADLVEFQGALGNITIKFAPDYSTKVFIKSTAIVLNLEIPAAVGAKIKTNSLIKQNNLKEKKFIQTDDLFVTEGYEQAKFKVDIELIGSATSLTVR